MSTSEAQDQVLLKTDIRWDDAPDPFKRKKIHEGKVRDTYYSYSSEDRIVVTTDRVSAFDVVMPFGIPGKGAILNMLSIHFMQKAHPIVPCWVLGHGVPHPQVSIGVNCKPFKIEMIAVSTTWRRPHPFADSMLSNHLPVMAQGAPFPFLINRFCYIDRQGMGSGVPDPSVSRVPRLPCPECIMRADACQKTCDGLGITTPSSSASARIRSMYSVNCAVFVSVVLGRISTSSPRYVTIVGGKNRRLKISCSSITEWPVEAAIAGSTAPQ
jgi:hypothetical protein